MLDVVANASLAGKEFIAHDEMLIVLHHLRTSSADMEFVYTQIIPMHMTAFAIKVGLKMELRRLV